MKSSNWIASFFLLINGLLALSNASPSIESNNQNATSSFETSKVQTLSGWLNGTSFPKGLIDDSNATISTDSPQDFKEFSYSTGEIVTIVTNNEVDKDIDQSNLYPTTESNNNAIGISTTSMVDNVLSENFTTIQPTSVPIRSESSAKSESREENGSGSNLPREHRSEEEEVNHKSVHDKKYSDMSSQANIVRIKVADSKRKSLRSKVMKRLRANQAGGESGKKKGNIIVVANGGGGSSDGVKQHIVQHIVPIFTPIHDQSTFDDKLEDKSGHINMFGQPIQPNMMAPVPIPHHHPVQQHQHSIDSHPHQWPGDESGLPPPSAMNVVRQTGRRTRHIMDNPLNDHHPLIHPMTETVNPDEPNLNMDETPRSSYNSMNLGDMLRGSLLAAAAAGEPISQNSGDMNYDNSGSDKLGLKAFSLLSESNSNVGSGYRPSSFMSSTPNRYNDWPATGGLVNNDDRLMSLLLEQSRSGIDYDRINGGDRLGLLGGHELSPSPLSAAKLTAASLLNDEVTLEDALKKLALFEILNKKQIPLTSQIFDEMRGQIGPGTGFHNHGFHQHLQHEVPNSPNDIKLLKSLRNKQKAQQDEEAASDVDDESGGKNSGNSRSKGNSEKRNRSKRLRKTIQANMAKLKDQTDRLRSRLRGNRGKDEEEDEYEDAGVEDEGEESRGKTRHEKPPTLARSGSRVLEASSTKQISSFIKSDSLLTTTEKPHTHKTCHQCCFGKSNLEPAAVSAIKAILNTNSNNNNKSL
ncbi:uncharacterized protein LOC141851033 isoform X2 [Brevipalpus obovatus]|uniref:uncharacterized protein LOC141851033 isoform X2 n=1 Tax=Brevipalpus obovatus TaxID=246614 RepID=UPI003D9DC6DF